MKTRFNKKKEGAIKRMGGIFLAAVGAVVVIHTVPLFVWYIILGLLLVFFIIYMFV